ncbi:MAG: AAA family ATPase [Eggerthellaceae bacterium]|nr:AAA family ATPase [Eggerthellaceae bacterium]
MDIKQATEQIKGAIRAYLSKNDRGLYRIPFHMQRPIIMFGPPGVGKTAIVAQIAEEMDINFVAYSITHHTRQSALGLPFISSRTYGDRDYNISEYTMSEIIPAVYDAVKESGVPR